MNHALLLSPATGYVADVLRDNPAAYWRLGELSGATAADSSRNQLTAADYVGSPTLGVSGAIVDGNPAVTFDGATQAVKYTGAPIPSTVGFWTIEAWVYPTAVANQAVFQNGGAANGYGMQLSATNELSIFVRNVGIAVSTLSVVPANEWSHLVVQDDGVTFWFWMNGQHKESVARSSTPGVDTSESNIGRFTNGAYARYFTGKIDEVAAYNSVLSAERIRSHYRSGLRK